MAEEQQQQQLAVALPEEYLKDYGSGGSDVDPEEVFEKGWLNTGGKWNSRRRGKGAAATALERKVEDEATGERTATNPGVIYLGRIPHGFYEFEMHSYFSQFGTVTRVRLARDKITGKSKNFAYIEFEHESVAKLVAESMNGYILYRKILKCNVIPPHEVTDNLFRGPSRALLNGSGLRKAANEYSTPAPAKRPYLIKEERDRRMELRRQLDLAGLNYLAPIPPDPTYDDLLLQPPPALPTENAEHVDPEGSDDDDDDDLEELDVVEDAAPQIATRKRRLSLAGSPEWLAAGKLRKAS